MDFVTMGCNEAEDMVGVGFFFCLLVCFGVCVY